jgi:hypothetical protein
MITIQSAWAATATLDELCANQTAARAASLRLAFESGADEATLRQIAAATRVSRGGSILLPARYANCSRARGWARLGRDAAAQWGEAEATGYRVRTAGSWLVYSSDGFQREERKTWRVWHLQIGDQTWTLADRA